MFSIVRTGGSYSSRFTGIIGVDNGSIALVETIENNGATVTVSSMLLQATFGSSVSCIATLQPLAVGGI